MKRAFLGVLTSVILLSAGTATAFAADYRDGHYFIDADGDGICDNCGIHHWCATDGAGCGRYFVDEDGDGICDNYGDNVPCGQGHRRGHGGHCGHGR